MREYEPHILILTGASHSNACHYGAPDFPALGVYFFTHLGLGKLELRFGRVLICFVEVAAVSTNLTPCFPLVRLSAVGLTLMHATSAPLVSRSCASIAVMQLPWL